MGKTTSTGTESSTGRREFVKRAAYVAPVIASISVAPQFAKAGSSKSGHRPPVTPPRGRR